MIQTAYLYIAHGSPKKSGNNQFIELVEKIKLRNPDKSVFYAFLENAAPDIPTAICQLADEGYERINVVPVFLFTGKHLDADIPEIIQSSVKNHDKLQISILKEVSLSKRFLPNVIKILRQQITKKQGDDLTLLFCGVGSSNQVSNINFLKFIHEIQNAFKHVNVIYGFFSDYASPNVEESLQNYYSEVNNSELIVFPVLLFEGFYTQKLNNILKKYLHVSEQKRQILPVLFYYDFLIDIMEESFI